MLILGAKFNIPITIVNLVRVGFGISRQVFWVYSKHGPTRISEEGILRARFLLLPY